ncbi:hypothetical protein AJ78_00389 [Emergomyces pasteurianus Ep9510]|uniref:Myb-like domain-containing protein n=1 Tax=Emergomyces pasteurianus Ep9510 TaxID=1447872 RepID=A0A1J9PTC9_9EURO|nr:hypothetical protein AJ78_00389 [Emergomyces pasteurianus Ep9510]
MKAPNKMNIRQQKGCNRQARAHDWTPEDCEKLLKLRAQHPEMTWNEFQLKCFPGRTHKALRHRLYARLAAVTVEPPNPILLQGPRHRVARVADVLSSDGHDDSLETDSYDDDTDDNEPYGNLPGDEPNCPETICDELVQEANTSPRHELENSRNKNLSSNSAKQFRTLESQHSSGSPTHFSMDSNTQPSGSNSHSPSINLAQITEYDAVYILRQAKSAEVYKSMLEKLREAFSSVKPEVDKITDSCSDIIQSNFGRSEKLDLAADNIGKIFRDIDAVLQQTKKY